LANNRVDGQVLSSLFKEITGSVITRICTQVISYRSRPEGAALDEHYRTQYTRELQQFKTESADNN